jgi:hypothetical protein
LLGDWCGSSSRLKRGDGQSILRGLRSDGPNVIIRKLRLTIELWLLLSILLLGEGLVLKLARINLLGELLSGWHIRQDLLRMRKLTSTRRHSRGSLLQGRNPGSGILLRWRTTRVWLLRRVFLRSLLSTSRWYRI